jgi:hypothetical protein
MLEISVKLPEWIIGLLLFATLISLGLRVTEIWLILVKDKISKSSEQILEKNKQNNKQILND